MRSVPERLGEARQGAAGACVILSANPIHDTGGGQRSAQLALEYLRRGYAVAFVSHGRVTETVDLDLRYDDPHLVQLSLKDALRHQSSMLDFAAAGVVITQVPLRRWVNLIEEANRRGARTVYDCIDRWDSELGRGWYSRSAEVAAARASGHLVASAPELIRHVEQIAEREVELLPNAFNSQIFDAGLQYDRPSDLPDGRTALYVGALWGGWFDWELLRTVAEANPDTQFVLIGDYRGEGDLLPDNCVPLGLKQQSDLPPYLAAADLALIPWTVDPVTQATSPLKVFEFVGMGLPVVAPDLGPLQGIPGVTLCGSADDVVQAVSHTGRDSLEPRVVEEMATFSARNSWVDRVDALERWSGRGSPAVHVGYAIGVAIPSYNHDRFIAAALDSVADQTLRPHDVVVVDDGSRDDSVARVRGHALTTRLVEQENQGAHVALNRAIALCRGEYVAILNSDDEFEADWVEQAWSVARHQRAGLVFGRVRVSGSIEDTQDHPIERWYVEAMELYHRVGLARALQTHNLAVTTSNFFVHRGLWRVLGGFRAFRYVHDYDFLLRAFALAPGAVAFVPDICGVRYRVHDANTISESESVAMDEHRAMKKQLREPAGRLKRMATASPRRRALALAIDATPSVVRRHGAEAEGPPVGLAVSTLDFGGLEEMVALLAETFAGLGREVAVYCASKGGEIAERLGRRGVPVTVGGDPGEWRQRHDIRVVSSHFSPGDVIKELSESVPVVETVQNCYVWFGDKEWEAERDKLQHVSGCIAVSDLVRRYYARHVEAPRTTVISNAVDPGRAAEVPKNFARRAMGLPEEACVACFVGRGAAQKNLPGLIAAFEEASRIREDLILVLVGPRRADIRSSRHAVELMRQERLRLVGSVRQVGVALSAADFYVSNSFYEGWSLAASEAAWVGLPIVSSEVGGAAELVDGGRGILVPNPTGDAVELSLADTRRESGHQQNHRALVEAMVDMSTRRDEWAGRRDAIRTFARESLGARTVALRYLAALDSYVDGVG
ncbi:MAG: glycosyltransferase [Gemmatimonadota bacterium]